MLLPYLDEQACPDFMHERARGQQVVGRLAILITERARSFRLQSMSFATVRCPEAAMQSELEKEFDLWRHGRPPNELGAQQRSHTDEKRLYADDAV